jgi:hypothetical protein
MLNKNVKLTINMNNDSYDSDVSFDDGELLPEPKTTFVANVAAAVLTMSDGDTEDDMENHPDFIWRLLV